MSNACYFEMKIAGEEPAVQEFMQMLEQGGLGQVSAFERNQGEAERASSDKSIVAISGSGSCVRSVKAAMIMNDGAVDLHSETERLGLVVEVFSAEPSIGFQEHLLMDRGDLIIDATADYQEMYVDWTDKESIQELMAETRLTEGELEARINECSELWLGGFENYGKFEALDSLIDGRQAERKHEPLDAVKQEAKTRAADKNQARFERPAPETNNRAR